LIFEIGIVVWVEIYQPRMKHRLNTDRGKAEKPTRKVSISVLIDVSSVAKKNPTRAKINLGKVRDLMTGVLCTSLALSRAEGN
jgi:hypothetical protein